ncbi:MAG TPA: molybdopterin molybdotransferase MoeA, partial [bacterium]|nr:molybdopterin molybdotransferase MoeA [bacterium]
MSAPGSRLRADPPIPFDEAVRRIADHVRPLPSEACPVTEAHARVLAETVTASHPVPPFDNSTVDGYALHAADVVGASEEAPVELTVVGEVGAGDDGRVGLGPGEAVRIMTGAPVPADADAIVMLEWTEWSGDRVRVRRPTEPGRFVRRAGEDIATGSTVLTAGRRLTPAMVGVLVSVGREQLSVHRSPRVGILATGDELLEPGAELTPGRIRGTNQYVLAGLVREAG